MLITAFYFAISRKPHAAPHLFHVIAYRGGRRSYIAEIATELDVILLAKPQNVNIFIVTLMRSAGHSGLATYAMLKSLLQIHVYHAFLIAHIAPHQSAGFAGMVVHFHLIYGVSRQVG